MITIREQLLQEIADFCARHKMAPSRFGEEALNARGFVHRLERNVHSPTLDTVEKVRAFMRTRDAAKEADPPHPNQAVANRAAAA